MPTVIIIADINSFVTDINDIRRPNIGKKIQENGKTKLVLERWGHRGHEIGVKAFWKRFPNQILSVKYFDRDNGNVVHLETLC